MRHSYLRIRPRLAPGLVIPAAQGGYILEQPVVRRSKPLRHVVRVTATRAIAAAPIDYTGAPSASRTVPTAQPSTLTAPTVPPAPPAVVASAPAEVAAKTVTPVTASPLNMTRDATANVLSDLGVKAVHDAGKLDVTQQIVKMLGALLLVLLMILGAVKLLRRYNLVPSPMQTADASAAPKKILADLRPTSNTTALFAAMQKTRSIAKPVETMAASNAVVAPTLTGANFTLLSSLKLPGSAASIHLVQAAEKTLLLGTSEGGGVSILTDVSSTGKSETTAVPLELTIDEPLEVRPLHEEMAEPADEAILAFADILREKAGLAPLSARQDVRSLELVDSRLSETQERLNGRLKAGAVLTATAFPSDKAPSRRRRVKTVAKASE
jgi:flagellar biogenesis protein FliO